MADYIKYLYKTVRKYFGEAIVVTQEVEDIISSPIVKESIINNSDCKILLDQRKYLNKFDSIQNLLGLTRYTVSRICYRGEFGRILHVHNGRNGKDGTFRLVRKVGRKSRTGYQTACRKQAQSRKIIN